MEKLADNFRSIILLTLRIHFVRAHDETSGALKVRFHAGNEVKLVAL